uniref:Tail fiber protein proximal subunit n=1 Tax=Acinetobacter phage vB_AbaSt_W16 TaxID=3116434 RepID=A0AB38ZCH9_9CAUD
MAEIKTSFRATYGIDAGGEKVINVKKADKTVMTDGVNVEYLIQENTTQMYDPERGYPKDFAVLFNGRLWYAKQATPTPAGPFNEGYWSPARTDPKWYQVAGNRTMQVGEYLTIDTLSVRNLELTLPSNAQEGDNITIRDVGGEPGYADILIKAGTQSIIDKGERLKEIKMTIPFSEWTFIYVNKLWTLYNGSEADLARTLRPADTPYKIQSGETILRSYDRASPIKVQFPKNANNGDMIHFVGMDAATSAPYFHLELNSFDANTSIIAPNTPKVVLQRSLSGYFIYNATTRIWMLFDSDMTDRLRTVSSDTNLFPNETVSVVGTSNATVPAFTLTLPTQVSDGDQITVALNYMRKGQTVNITASGRDMILTNKNLTQFPKRKDYPEEGNWVNTKSLQYNGASDYPPVITFAYIIMNPDPDPTKFLAQWMVVDNNPMIERVDPTNPARLGVIALATQNQANLDKGQIAANPIAKELAITPETLANRTALESRQGIAAISTKDQNSLPTDSAAYDDLTIVTPLKLNQKQATETMRGLAEIVDDTEIKSNTNDTHIITPKKLDARRATASLSGVAMLVETGGVSATARNAPGTGIFNYADNARVITPTTLREFKATETQQGGGFLAMDSEVIAGTPNPAGIPLLVTPEQLHKKTATTGRIGFVQTATEAEVLAGTDPLKYVSPFTLAKRVATDSATGLARFAKQTEFNAGTAGLISDPAVIKTFFSDATRTEVDNTSGLTQSGNLWTSTVFNIVAPTDKQRGTARLSTQAEVNTGTDYTTIVTPLTLHNKKSTTTAEGIIRVATDAETNTGTSTNTAVCPLSLKNMIQKQESWAASNIVRGPVLLSEGAMTFAGNDVTGSTAALLPTYKQVGYAISPYELNKTLMNFLPAKAKAVDSDKLDGFDSTQFVRRDIDQTVAGSITFTKPIVVKDAATVEGLLLAGTPGANGYDKPAVPVLGLKAIVNGANWIFACDGTSKAPASPKIHFGYKYNGASDAAIDIQAFEINHNGETSFNSTLTVAGASTFKSSLNVSDIINTDLGYRIDGRDAITVVDNITKVGTIARPLDLIGSDAGNIRALDSGTVYQVLTTKNRASILDPLYVKKSGDTMTGALTLQQASIRAIRTESATFATAAPTATTAGSWSSNIVTAAIYNLFPGYLVPVFDKLKPTIIESYTEVKGPGILSQVGTDKVEGTYQIWAPRPTVATANHNANTIYTRIWNPVKNAWEGWSYAFNSSIRPTASDIGAIPNNGSALDNLTIRDWIQVGNLRIYADPLTKNVRFDWIE